MVELKDIFSFIAALVWPIVILVVLLSFRRPLSDFLRTVADRATGFSIMQFVTFELSLPEASHLQKDKLLPVLPSFASGIENRGRSNELLAAMEGDKVDYLVIDLGKGDRWLTSRLFISTIMLPRMRGLRCLVFLETRDSVRHRFLGIASPNEVQSVLARRYPWLQKAYIEAQFDIEKHRDEFVIQSPDMAVEIVTKFISKVQNGRAYDEQHPPDPSKKSEWEFVPHGQYWEHANWINGTSLERDLGDVLQKSAWFEDSPEISKAKRVQAILRRKGSFVASVGKDKEFESLIDRDALLEQVAERVVTFLEEEPSSK